MSNTETIFVTAFVVVALECLSWLMLKRVVTTADERTRALETRLENHHELKLKEIEARFSGAKNSRDKLAKLIADMERRNADQLERYQNRNTENFVTRKEYLAHFNSLESKMDMMLSIVKNKIG